MKKEIYKVDAEGFIVDNYLGEFDESGELISHIGDYITTDLPQPLSFYKPKWTGAEWIEGATQEEMDELTKVVPSPPTQDERIKELETIVNLLLMGGL